MASKMVLVAAVIMMVAALICGVASARTLASSSSSMDNNVMKNSEPKSEPNMEKSFFHPFFPPYGLIGHGGPYLGGGILKGGGFGPGLGFGGGFGSGLNGGLGNADGDELGGRKDERNNGADQNNNNGAAAAYHPQVILENGLVKLTISKPQGLLTCIKYGGLDNLLDTKSSEASRGYWDLNWNLPGGQDKYQLLTGSDYSVIQNNDYQSEISFRNTYQLSSSNLSLPLSVDFRYILRSGVSGFYCYAIYERPPGCPAFDLTQTRMVFRLRREKFHYMAISDEKQRIMPMPEDLMPQRSRPLIVPESVLLTNPINPELRGEANGGVHGWISSGPFIGFWIIFPSHEFRNGGPTKQNLTVHTGPFALAMLHGTHYIGEDAQACFEEGETWRKVFGPFFVYLNSTSDVSKAYNLWTDAKKQWMVEKSAWPYDFVSSPYYLAAKERGSVSGRLLVQDRFVSASLIAAKDAYVGLSIATTEGSWQTESKNYQFWIQTDSNGNFTIRNVVPGEYRLHGWVPGFIGDYLREGAVAVSGGSEVQLENLIFSPLREGPTIWQIGFPDRTSIEYNVPKVNPKYVNKLFLNSPEKYRQYGLWDRYTDLYPESDVVFTIGVSDPKKDWFFAHVDRKEVGKYCPSTWEIKFNLTSLTNGIYKLRLAVASATRSDLKVHVNNISLENLVFQVMNLGTDNTVCRHGIHGLYRLFSIDISSSLLHIGDNNIFLTQARGGDALCGILYDYIRLEAPSRSLS
ncbi:OLC1v1027878C1 [Oldenlandia corymbosa var. corymbosa]|uniref:rhamnogalacturonan endolyase n=1 Tax=Oldenlandia corymbosa var. corymbosa TaxID=529605 RepID=A0AAV1CAG1_OLDCO|nr:OLC1v1027878C1 [Oldenlandia corymbosa var. corymbosa]